MVVHTITEAADRIGLKPNKEGKLEVIVASREKLASLQRCNIAQICLQKVAFIYNIFILPLKDYDVVLGKQWLRTLRLIK